MMIRQRSFSPYWASNDSFMSFSVTWTFLADELPQRQGRVDDVAGVLDRADPPFLVEGAKPGLAADAGHAHGNVVDLGVDLGGGHLELFGAKCLLDQLSRDQGLEDLLALTRDALVGELLTGDGLGVDGGDRVGRVDRDRGDLQPGGVVLIRGRRGLRRGRCRGCCRCRGLGTSLDLSHRPAVAEPDDPSGGQGEDHHPKFPTAKPLRSSRGISFRRSGQGGPGGRVSRRPEGAARTRTSRPVLEQRARFV